jgi:Protein of unknown function (DUF2934)
MKTNLQNKPLLSVVNDPPSQVEQIRARAYELYLERGQEDGHDLEDWFRAEQDVTTVTAGAIAA